jgi:phage gpG-like protein
MIRFELDTSDMADLEQRLAALGPRATVQVARALQPLIYRSVRASLQKHFTDSPGKSRTRLHSRSGRLFNSVLDSLEASIDGGEIKVSLGSDLPYAAIHEYGGYAGRRGPFKKKRGHRPYIPPRPYLRPTLNDLQQALPALIEKAVAAFPPQTL